MKTILSCVVSIAVATILVGCEQQASVTPALTVNTVAASAQVATVPITFKSEVLDDVVVGGETRVRLTFQLQAMATVSLRFIPNDGVDISEVLTLDRTADNQGLVQMDVPVIVQQSGKQYLKLLASIMIGGELSTRAFVVPLVATERSD